VIEGRDSQNNKNIAKLYILKKEQQEARLFDSTLCSYSKSEGHGHHI
jgi:hypothetical protein